MRTVLLRVRPESPMAMIYDLRITSSRFLAGDPEKEKEGKKCLEAAQIQRPCGLRQLYITISKLVCFQRSRSIVVLLHPEKSNFRFMHLAHKGTAVDCRGKVCHSARHKYSSWAYVMLPSVGLTSTVTSMIIPISYFHCNYSLTYQHKYDNGRSIRDLICLTIRQMPFWSPEAIATRLSLFNAIRRYYVYAAPCSHPLILTSHWSPDFLQAGK